MKETHKNAWIVWVLFAAHSCVSGTEITFGIMGRQDVQDGIFYLALHDQSIRGDDDSRSMAALSGEEILGHACRSEDSLPVSGVMTVSLSRLR